MRKRFEQQFVLGRLPINETPVPTGKRGGALPKLVAALKEIYVTPKWNERVFEILESKLTFGKKQTGRPGMDLWQIFVLAQARLVQNISYDELFDLANYHTMIRQLMGVESGFGYEKYQFEYQNIYDNVSLLDDETVCELNQVIVEFGHEVFKKKEIEMTSNFELILPLIITTVIASVVTALLGNKPIYTTLLERTLADTKSAY